MEILRKTLDLDDELAEIDSTIDQIESRLNRQTEQAIELDPPEDEEERAEFAEIKEEVEYLEQLLDQTRGYHKVVERAIAEWDGTEIVIRELTGAETRNIKDEAQEKAARRGVEGYSDNIHETLLLETSVESTPAGAPPPTKIGNLPNRLFDWLLTRANNLNTVGGFDAGNSSLRTRMAERQAADDTRTGGAETPTRQTS